MKKNRMMRLASGLLVAVLLSTCAISGTFAKYVTSDKAEDSARVAKWGVDIEVGSDLFDATYAKEDSNYAAMQLSVQSDDTKNVVAPGTSGNGYSFEVTGTPEVSYKVSFAITENTTPETVFLGTYYPVEFALEFNGAAVEITAQDIATVMTAITNCAYYFDVTNGKYYVTTDGGTTWGAAQDTAPTLELSWAWDFDDNGAGTYDEEDTILGDLAAGKDVANGTAYNLDIAFDITATATQID